MNVKDWSRRGKLIQRLQGRDINIPRELRALMTILVTNDDSLDSPGIYSLAKAASRVEDVIIVAPKSPKSGISKAMTFHKMMRASESTLTMENRKVPAVAITGTPADCVMFAESNYDEKFSLVVSGINPGDNTSYHSILTSGTMGACFEAALLGIPAISFSLQSKPENWFNHDGFQLSEEVVDLVERVIRLARKRGLPEDTSMLAVNIPMDYTKETAVKFRVPQMLRIDNRVSWSKDPLGNDYFWLTGTAAYELEKGKDCYELLEKGNVVITPLNLRFCPEECLEKLREWFV